MQLFQNFETGLRHSLSYFVVMHWISMSTDFPLTCIRLVFLAVKFELDCLLQKRNSFVWTLFYRRQ